MMEARISALFKNEEEYTILEKMSGKSLEGKSYKPILPYFAHVSLLFITSHLFDMLFAYKIFFVIFNFLLA